MGNYNKLIRKIVKKQFSVQATLLDEGDGVSDSKTNIAINYAKVLRNINKNPSLVELTYDELNKYSNDINQIKQLIEEKEKYGALSSVFKKEYREVVSIYNDRIATQIANDIDKHIKLMISIENNENNNSNPEYDKINTLFLNSKLCDDKYLYLEYIKNALEYQYKFALRAKDITGYQLTNYKTMAESDQLVSSLNEAITLTKTISFTFHYNPLKPLEMSFYEVEEFKSNIKYIMEANAEITKRIRYIGPIVDIPRDDTGRIMNRNGLDELYGRWQKYLDAFDCIKNGMEFEEIYNMLHVEKHVSDKRKIIASYIDYAKRYIRAVELGTFPHLEQSV